MLLCVSGAHGTSSVSSSINRCLIDCDLDSNNKLDLHKCSIHDEDITSGDLVNCLDKVGRENIETLSLGDNFFTTLPEGLFDGMNSLVNLWFNDHEMESIPENIFDGLVSLESLSFNDGKITAVPEGLFSGLGALSVLDFGENEISSLPLGVFDDLLSLISLDFGDNDIFSLPEGVFDNLESLESIWMEDNNFIDLSPGIFSNLRSLDFLNLQGNPLNCLPFSFANTIYVEDNTPDCTDGPVDVDSEDFVGDQNGGVGGITSGASTGHSVLGGWILLVGITTALVII